MKASAPAVISGLIAKVLADLEEKRTAPVVNPGNATKNGKFSVGQTVLHKKFGLGVTVAQWGSYFTCRECNLDMSTLPVNKVCPHCHRKSGWINVSAREIYQVRFGHDRLPRSINQCWLTKAKK